MALDVREHAGVDVTPAVRAKAIADEANQRKAATLRHRLRLLLSDGVAENDAAARAAESAVLAPAARTTVMATFAAAVDDLPDLVDPVDSFVWRETFMKHARHADTALAEFNRELDSRFGPADSPRRHHGELWSRQVLPPAASCSPTWTRPTYASTPHIAPALALNGFPQKDAMTTTSPLMTGADGLRAIPHVPLPPLARTR